MNDGGYRRGDLALAQAAADPEIVVTATREQVDAAKHGFFWHVGHFLGIVGDDPKPLTAQQRELGSRFVATYSFAVQRHARDMADPNFAAMSARLDAQAQTIATSQAAAQRQITYGVVLAATGPAVAAFGVVTAPASVPGFLAASGTEGAYLGSLTRGAGGGDITAGSIAIDGGLGVAGGLAGRYVVAPLAGQVIARLSPSVGSAVPAIGGRVPNAGGVIREFAQEGDQVYYRVFSDSPVGSFLTAVPPRSSAFAREALALPPANQATFIQEVLVPSGTPLLRSRALSMPWGGRGGAEQFELLTHIPTTNFGPGVPLP